jgi:four helix bundle protein
MPYHSFEDLEVWKKACRLTIRIYRELQGSRDYSLKDQMTRSAVSIASNIAEGAERGSGRDFKRFLTIAKGSAAELRTQIYIAERVGTLPHDKAAQFVSDVKHVSAMLHKLTKSISRATAN